MSHPSSIRFHQKVTPFIAGTLVAYALQLFNIWRAPQVPDLIVEHSAPAFTLGIQTCLNLINPLLAGVLTWFFVAPRSNTVPNIVKRKNASVTYGPMTWERNGACRGWLITGATGTGKEIDEDTAILVRTPEGSVIRKRAGEVIKGDVVFSWMGAPASVIDVYPQGVKRMFRITLASGDFALCGRRHLWRVRDGDGEESVVTTEEIITRYTREELAVPKLVAGAESPGEVRTQMQWDAIVSVTPDREAKAVCLAVNDATHLFALGNGILTHNTQICINPLMHSFFINECGKEKAGWASSKTAKNIKLAKERFRRKNEAVLKRSGELRAEIEGLELKRERLLDDAIAGDIDHYLKLDENASVIDRIPPDSEAAQGVRVIDEEIAAKEKEEDELLYKVHLERLELQKLTDKAKELQYEVYPWGGICCDEKGLYWQTLQGMAIYHNRDDDLMLLQTRPDWAGPNWEPPAKFNLLSDDSIPADTYAKLILDTAKAVTGATDSGGNEFFVTQATIQIGWALRLIRAIRARQIEMGYGQEAGSRPVMPSLTTILKILTVRENYNQFLADTKTVETQTQGPMVRDARTGKIIERPGRLIPPAVYSDDIAQCRHALEKDYWQQPDEQRGGVTSTIYNYLAYFQDPAIAEVFCDENTFDFREVSRGKILCIAMPQKFSIQRRYVTTILKNLFYQYAKNRFDLKTTSKSWTTRNMLICWQDEAQRFIIEEDGNVDILREAQVTTVMAAQTQNALLQALGDKARAEVILSNLSNRMICRSALEECAEMSAKIIGKHEVSESSISTSSSGTSISRSKKEKYMLEPRVLMGLKDFHVYVRPAEGDYLYRLFCVQPITPDGKIPFWWFGTFNPFTCLMVAPVNTPVERILPPPVRRYARKLARKNMPFWKGKAPAKAKMRYLMGRETTFIELASRKRVMVTE